MRKIFVSLVITFLSFFITHFVATIGVPGATPCCFGAGLPWRQTDFSSGRWMAAGYVLYLPLDKGSGPTAYDQSGYGNDGIFVNNPSWVNGKYGMALQFDGTNDYVNCGSDGSLNCTDALTIEAWVYLTATNSYYYNTVIQRISGNHGYVLRTGDARVNFRIGDGTNWHTINGLSTFTLNTWHHIAVTYKANQKVVSYIDGVLDQQTDIGYSIAGDSTDLYISQGTSLPERTFNGIIDEVRIYDRALSQKEVSSMFQSSGVYISPDYDCGNTFTLGKIYWNADIAAGCSITFQVSTAGSQNALGDTGTWGNTIVATSQNPDGSVELDVLPGRWIRYRVIVGMPAGISGSVVLNQIKIAAAVQGITTTSNGSATPVLKLGEQLQFEIDFAVDMDTDKCEVVINTEGGNSITIPGALGNWQGRKFISSAYTIIPATGGGFADVYVTKAKTSIGQTLYHYYPRCLIIDTAEIVPAQKYIFFPNPFSPNGDGKADETSLVFNLAAVQEITLRIYNLKGRLVRTLRENIEYQGNTEIKWDGKNDNSLACPIGIYIYSLRIGTEIKNGTVVLSK